MRRALHNHAWLDAADPVQRERRQGDGVARGVLLGRQQLVARAVERAQLDAKDARGNDERLLLEGVVVQARGDPRGGVDEQLCAVLFVVDQLFAAPRLQHGFKRHHTLLPVQAVSLSSTQWCPLPRRTNPRRGWQGYTLLQPFRQRQGWPR